MLIVTSLSGETEALADVQSVEVNEEVNGDFSIAFTALNTEKNGHSFHLLTEESIVELDGQEFRVKKMNESRDRKSIFAQHMFFDLIEHQIYGINGGTKTADEFFSIVLTGTGWTFENIDVNYSRLIPNFGEGNALALIRQICASFECELKIEPGRQIKIYKEIGEDTDQQFRYKHNIKTLRRSVDTSKLATVIKGYGGGGLEVTYTSPNAAVYGNRHAEPVRDERYTIPDSMLERLKQELIDVPEISIELEVLQLGFNASLGDKVWTIYEPLNIEFQQRVISKRTFPFTRKSPVVSLSNKKSAITDLLTETKIEINENQKQTRSRFEQTNERISLEVERIDESIATLEIEADNITLSVQSLDQRMGSAESTLSVQAGMISSKVSYGEVISSIEQSAEAIKISAGKIQLTGITNVAETLTIGSGMGNVASIQFNGHDTWIYSSGDGLAFDSLGFMQFLSDVYFYSTVDFGNAYVQNLTASNANNANYLNGYNSSDFAKTTQGATIALNSAGTLSVQLANGKTANFAPTYWSG